MANYLINTQQFQGHPGSPGKTSRAYFNTRVARLVLSRSKFEDLDFLQL